MALSSSPDPLPRFEMQLMALIKETSAGWTRSGARM
jgi:hypothetical protein